MGSEKCPPGLESLVGATDLYIVQDIKIVQELLGVQEKNSYVIYNDRKEAILYIKEESNIFCRLCLLAERPLKLRIFEMGRSNRQILLIKKPFKCPCCICFCCLPMVEVFLPDGTPLGRVQQKCRIDRPRFDVKDPTGNVICIIRGPIVQCCISKFAVLSKDRQVVYGMIRKRFAGVLRETFTQADFFSINYSQNLEVRTKALLLAATILIDFLYFENMF